jgi:hypothetical protein
VKLGIVLASRPAIQSVLKFDLGAFPNALPNRNRLGEALSNQGLDIGLKKDDGLGLEEEDLCGLKQSP